MLCVFCKKESLAVAGEEFAFREAVSWLRLSFQNQPIEF